MEATTTRSKSGSAKALADLVSNLDINETDSEETDGSESEAKCPEFVEPWMTARSGYSVMCVEHGGT